MPVFALCNIQYTFQHTKAYMRTSAPSEDSDQPAHSLCAFLIANDAKFLHVDNEVQANLSLCWTHMSEGTFSHVCVMQCMQTHHW